MRVRADSTWGDQGWWILEKAYVGRPVLGRVYHQLTPTFEDQPGAKSFELALADAKAISGPFDVVGEAQLMARSVYAMHGIPSGERRWAYNAEIGACRPEAKFGDEFLELLPPWKRVEEEDLWLAFGEPDGDDACVAGEVLKHAQSVKTLLPRLSASDPNFDLEFLPEVASALTLASFRLGVSMTRLDILITKTEPYGKTGADLSDHYSNARTQKKISATASVKSRAARNAKRNAKALALARNLRTAKPSCFQKDIAFEILNLEGDFDMPEFDAVCWWIRNWEAEGSLEKKTTSKNLKQRR